MTSKFVSSRPVKMWIHGKCFNIKKFEKKFASKKKVEENIEINSLDSDKSIKDCHTIFEENGQFTTKFKLPELYYRKLLQVPEFNLEELSEQMKSEIIVPAKKDDDHIVVHSKSKDNLYNTVEELHSVVAHIRKKSMALQFLCIPCTNEGVKERFKNLKREILALENIDGMHESIFMAPEKLHLTITVFVLLDEIETIEAINALLEYKKNTLDSILQNTGPITISISGLDCMNNNIEKVDVLYAKAEMSQCHEDHTLQSIVNDMSDHFYHKGFLKEHQENVKLHMTVINTKYRKMLDMSNRKRPKRMSIDATHIMEKFGTTTLVPLTLTTFTCHI